MIICDNNLRGYVKIKDPKEYALYLLKFKDRSERGVEEKMKQKGFFDSEIKEVIVFLLKKKLIDEKKLADNIIRDGLEFKLWGKYRIQKKLLQEMIKNNIVEQSLAEISYEDELKSILLARDKWQKRNKLKSFEDKQKLMGFLSRRGYGFELISEVCSQID